MADVKICGIRTPMIWLLPVLPGARWVGMVFLKNRRGI